MRKRRFQNRFTCSHRPQKNPAIGGASQGSGVATPALQDEAPKIDMKKRNDQNTSNEEINEVILKLII
jgi:hypothetical protein